MSPQATKQQILTATIDAIEKYGLQNITTRVIAEEAGVNNAALHYYYGTKEQLLEQALSSTLNHMLEDTEEMIKGIGGLEERLRSVLTYLVEGTIAYPNLIRAHLQGPLMEGEVNSPLANMISTWLDNFDHGIEMEITAEQRKNLRIAAYSAISAIILSGLMPEVPNTAVEINLKDLAFKQEFIQYHIERIMEQVKE